MADMSKLLAVYAQADGTASTSDGKLWQYVAAGLPGSPGVLAQSEGEYSVVFSDSGSAGVQTFTPPSGTVITMK